MNLFRKKDWEDEYDSQHPLLPISRKRKIAVTLGLPFIIAGWSIAWLFYVLEHKLYVKRIRKLEELAEKQKQEQEKTNT